MIAPVKTKPAPVSRMTLANITRGRVEAPIRMLLYGVPGVGKSTFAAAAPSPIFLGAEDGTGNLDVARFPLVAEWSDVLDAVRLLSDESHDHRTLVIDTLDSIEPLCWRAVVASDSKAKGIEDVGGGYGKGYVAAVDQWRMLLAGLDRLRARGMVVLLLAHAHIKPFRNPEGSDYDRYQMKLDARAAAVFAEWCDLHLFARFETWAEEQRGGRAKGIGGDTRVIHAQRTAAFDAKNRYSLPATLPLSWEDVAVAVKLRQVAAPADLRAAIEAAIDGQPAELAAKVRAAVVEAGEDAVRLAALDNRLRARIGSRETT